MMDKCSIFSVFEGLRGRTRPIVTITFSADAAASVACFLTFIKGREVELAQPYQEQMLRDVADGKGWPEEHDHRVGFTYDPDFTLERFATQLHEGLDAIETSA